MSARRILARAGVLGALLLLPLAPVLADAADKELNFALQLLNNNMAQSALDHFRDFIDNNPRHARLEQAYFGLARCLELTGDTSAYEVYRQYLKNYPNGPHAMAVRLNLGVSLYNAGLWSDARAALAEYVTKYPAGPDTPTACFYAGLALLKLDRPDEAIVELQRAAASATGMLRAEASYSAAAAYFRARRYDEALEALSVVTRTFPGTPVAAKAEGLLGDIFFKRGDFSQARRHYAEALRADLGHADEYAFWRAMAAARLGDTPAGVGEMLDIAEKYPSGRWTQKSLLLAADWSLATGDTVRAERALHLLVENRGATDQDRAFAAFNLGHLAFLAGDAGTARRYFLEVLRLDAGYLAEAEYYLGLIALDAERYPEAENYLRSVERRAAGTTLEEQALVARITLAGRAGNTRTYRELIEKMEKRDSRLLVSALYRQADAAFTAGNLDAAAEQYEVILQRYPNSSEAVLAQYQLGLTRYYQARYEDAERYLKLFLKTAGRERSAAALVDNAWYWIGFARYQSGQMEAAYNAFLEVARIDGSDLRLAALQRAGDAAFSLGRADDALRCNETIIAAAAAGPVDTAVFHDAIYNRAVILRNLGRVDEARQGFLRAYESDPASYEDALLKAAECLQDANKDSEAARAFESAAGRIAAPGLKEQALFRAGLIYEAEHRTAAATALFTQVAGFRGALAPDALYSLGRIARAAGDTAGALAAWRQAADEYPLTLFGRRAALELAQREPDTAALPALAALVKAAPDDAVAALARLARGRILAGQGALDTGVREIKAALDNLPDNASQAEARLLLGEIALQRNRALEAKLNLDRVYHGEPFPGDEAYRARAGLALGRALAQLGRKAEAINILEEVADNYPEAAPAAKELLQTLQ